MSRSLLLALVLPLAACFSEAPAGDTDSETCEPGALGCDCFGNDTCLEDLVCNASVKHCVRENCLPGENGCVCDTGSCDEGLVCSDGMVCGGGTTMPTTTATTTAGMTTGGMTGSTTSPQLTTSTTMQSSGPLDSSSSGGQGGSVTLYFGGDASSLFGVTTGSARADADAICASAFPPGVECSDSVALLSDNRATIATLDIPQNSLVLNGVGGTVAANFASLLASGPDGRSSLRDAGVDFVVQGDGQVVLYATGADIDGGLADNCSNWAGNGSNTFFAVGAAGLPGLAWLNAGTQACSGTEGDSQSHALCACWTSD